MECPPPLPYEYKTLFWNVRGLNDPNKHKPLSQWLLLHKPIFGALIETHIKETQLSYVMARTCGGWNFVSNHQSDEDGRVIVIWKAPPAVRVLGQARQSLTCEIQISNGLRFYYTAIYAANTNEERQDLWVDLLNIQQALSLDIYPWILGGDFNQIIHHAEHSSSRINSITPPMVSFQNTLTQLVCLISDS